MSNVKRSTYQRKAEECKRLLTDIKILVEGTVMESMDTRLKYKKKFRKEMLFWKLIKNELTKNEYKELTGREAQ